MTETGTDWTYLAHIIGERDGSALGVRLLEMAPGWADASNEELENHVQVQIESVTDETWDKFGDLLSQHFDAYRNSMLASMKKLTDGAPQTCCTHRRNPDVAKEATSDACHQYARS